MSQIIVLYIFCGCMLAVIAYLTYQVRQIPKMKETYDRSMYVQRYLMLATVEAVTKLNKHRVGGLLTDDCYTFIEQSNNILLTDKQIADHLDGLYKQGRSIEKLSNLAKELSDALNKQPNIPKGNHVLSDTDISAMNQMLHEDDDEDDDDPSVQFGNDVLNQAAQEDIDEEVHADY